MQLKCRIRGAEQAFPLAAGGLRIGRDGDNDLVLSDPSVSRYHASVRLEGETFWISDLGSTNGVLLNGERVHQAPLAIGDTLRIGTFDLVAGHVSVAREVTVAGQSTVHPAGAGDSLLATGSYVRPLADFLTHYGIEGRATTETPAGSSAASPPPVGTDTLIALPRQDPDEDYASSILGYLTRLASQLLTAKTVDEVLERLTEICFEALPVDRGFVLLLDPEGRAVCELARFGDRVVPRPDEEVPVSETMLHQVIQKRVALMTLDAQADERLLSGASIQMHQIRAAMCVPLWSLERIVGVIQVDSPFRTDCFSQRDLDFLVAVANYAAVAVERVRNAEEAERERKLMGRLERYHSPAVIDAVLRGGESDLEGQVGRLQPAQATVLFADLVGFSAFAERSKPEEVAALLEGFFDRSVEAIFEVGGTLDKFIGDCVMAFFGTPVVQVDHARRAVTAAIEIQRALVLWNVERATLGREPVVCRIAINSGPVMVGEVGSRGRVDYTVLGNTVNVAARLDQFVARPGEIVIGAATRRELGDDLPLHDLGEQQLKGLTQKVGAFRVENSLWES